jgi:hypothetical protein
MITKADLSTEQKFLVWITGAEIRQPTQGAPSVARLLRNYGCPLHQTNLSRCGGQVRVISNEGSAASAATQSSSATSCSYAIISRSLCFYSHFRPKDMLIDTSKDIGEHHQHTNRTDRRSTSLYLSATSPLMTLSLHLLLYLAICLHPAPNILARHNPEHWCKFGYTRRTSYMTAVLTGGAVEAKPRAGNVGLHIPRVVAVPHRTRCRREFHGDTFCSLTVSGRLLL